MKWFVIVAVAVLGAPLSAQEASPLKISGYVQAQYVDSEQKNEDTFSVRRGRLVFQYQISPIARLVVQPDFSSSGVVLRDAYGEISEPWSAWKHTLTAGQFKVPFGYEIRLSSRDREMPERPRVITTLFPGERDRGVMLSGATGAFNYRVAVLNGNGISSSRDSDEEKDVAGRIGFKARAIEVGLSGYQGTQLEQDKIRYGADAQWTTPLPGLRLRGEYVQGQQPGANRERDVRGFYAYAVQDVGKRHQFVLRYDTYDPNTDSSGDTVDTLGGAYAFRFDSHVKLMLAYEMPEHEVDDPADNVATVRLQFSF